MGSDKLDYSFTYYKDSKKKRKCNSNKLVPKILEAFRAGSGYTLNMVAFVGESSTDEGKKLFRKRLKQQLKKVLGHEPVFEKEHCGDSAYTVWEN
jgi:hypothetical protein